MIQDIPQFVPSKVCLSCEGCCRFKEEASPWRPKISREEVDRICRAGKKSTAKNLFQDVVDEQGYIKAHKSQGAYRCRFLDLRNNRCRIYTRRPFECRLYPFLLTQDKKQTLVWVHLSCPYIQERWDTEAFDQHVGHLKKFFAREDVAASLNRNSFLPEDYPEYRDELKYLFTL
jgi:Fe-S-cluster containining protein